MMSTATGMRRSVSPTTATTNLVLPPRRLFQRPNAPLARRAVPRIEKSSAVVRAAAPESSGQPQSPARSGINGSSRRCRCRRRPLVVVVVVVVELIFFTRASHRRGGLAGGLGVCELASGAPVLAAAAAVAAQLGGKLAGVFD